MQKVFIASLSIFLVMTVAGCKLQRLELARNAQTELIGVTKNYILGCAGVPHRKAKEGSTEFLTYVSGGDSVGSGTYSSSGSGSVFGTLFSQRRYCEVTFVIYNDLVTRVNYTGRTGGLLTQGEQCGFVLQNCL